MSKKEYKKPQVKIEQLEQQLLEANLALWQTNLQLESEQKSKAELLSNLSHDLRAPLAALRSTVDLMKSRQEMSGEERDTLLNIMERRLQMLETMVNDLFLLTQVENKNDKPETELLNVGFFIEEFFYSCEADSKFEKRRLYMEVPEDFSYYINVNVQQMLRVLDNLITNALRYSKDGDSITIGAKIQTDKTICIYIEDSGEGISSEDMEHIFDRSFRADRSRTPLDGGSGLGLAIAKGIVEQHEGNIWCESVKDKGSRFSIELPFQYDES